MCAFSHNLRLTVRPRSLAQEQTIVRVSSVILLTFVLPSCFTVLVLLLSHPVSLQGSTVISRLFSCAHAFLRLYVLVVFVFASPFYGCIEDQCCLYSRIMSFSAGLILAAYGAHSLCSVSPIRFVSCGVWMHSCGRLRVTLLRSQDESATVSLSVLLTGTATERSRPFNELSKRSCRHRTWPTPLRT